MPSRIALFAIALRAGLTLLAGVSSAAPADDLVPPFHDGSTTLVVLPDTEGYAAKHPETFVAMMKWVADHRARRNIAAILHVGDVTNNNTEREWRVARQCFDLVEGQIPYVLAAGNHDYDHTPGRLTLMNDYFKVADLKKRSSFGGVYEPGKLENHYQFVEIQGRKWLVLSLEMGPRQSVVEWGNKVLADHNKHPAIVLTHGYLYYDNQRYNHHHGKQRATPHNFYGEGADGEQLWNGLVRRHPNVMMVICGHLSSGYVGYRVDEGDYGNLVHQMMVDYEKLKGGGMGFLRLLEFLPDRKTIQVRTYSPVTGGKNPRDPKLEEFSFKLRAATSRTPRRTTRTPAKPLTHAPLHRYSFGGKTGERTLHDALGKRPGRLEEGATLNGTGQLVLTGKAVATLPGNLLLGKTDLSFELWFTPTASRYDWSAPVRLGSADDWFTYVFRTLTTHRAEIAIDRHNEDIQQAVPAKPGQVLHVVVTYDADGTEGRPLLSYYRDGELRGRMPTKLQLSDITEDQNRLGPFAGEFDEFRIYRHPLTPGEVASNYLAGPEHVVVADAPSP